jgi:hypothetical protein
VRDVVYWRPLPVASWGAIAYKLNVRPFALSVAVPLNGSIQVATVQSAAPDPTVSIGPFFIWKVTLHLENNSAAAKVLAEIRRLNPGGAVAATGNPGVNMIGVAAGGAGTQPTGLRFLCLPTTPGTEIAGDVFGSRELNLGITGAASIVSPPPEPTPIVLWDATSGAVPPLQIKAGQKDGYAVVLDSNAATTILCTVNMVVSWKNNTQNQLG